MKSALWVIAQREYIQRVKTKGFVIGTLLGPIFMIALIAIPVFVMVAVDEQVTRKIAIVDETGVLADALDFPLEFEMVQLDVPVDTIRHMVEEQLLDGYLLLPADVLQGRGPASFYSRGGGGLMFSTQLQQVVDRAVRQRRLVDAGAPDAVLRILNENVDVRMVKLTDQGEEADAATALAGIGYVMGFVIYICMFIYGAFVMRGVIEEKTNRIAELIASSARPFQLMMGKVLGIGAMGLTQFLVWCILGMGIMGFGGAIAALFIDPTEYGLTETTNQQAVLDAAGVTIPQIPFSAFVLIRSLFHWRISAVRQPVCSRRKRGRAGVRCTAVRASDRRTHHRSHADDRPRNREPGQCAVILAFDRTVLLTHSNDRQNRRHERAPLANNTGTCASGRRLPWLNLDIVPDLSRRDSDVRQETELHRHHPLAAAGLDPADWDCAVASVQLD